MYTNLAFNLSMTVEKSMEQHAVCNAIYYALTGNIEFGMGRDPPECDILATTLWGIFDKSVHQGEA